MDRGQVFSVDLVIAVVAFTVVMFLAAQVWSNSLARIDDWQERVEIQKAANTASFFLVVSQGYPDDWNRTTVQVLGLTNGEQNTIEHRKFAELLTMDLSETKQFLNVEQYGLFLNLTNQSSGLEIGSKGIPPDISEAFEIAKIDSYVLYNRSMCILQLSLWKD